MPRWLRLFLQTVLTLGGLAALVWVVDASALVASLRSAQWAWVGAAGLLLPLNLWLDGWVWQRLLGPVEGTVSGRNVAKGVLSGLALGFWTPARLGEYAGRAFSIADADPWTVSVSVFVQRMVDMLAGVSIGLALLLGALWIEAIPTTFPWILAALLGAGTTALLGLGLLRPALLHRLAIRMDRWDGSVSDRTAFLTRLSSRDRAVVLGGSLSRYLVFTTQFGLLGLAFGAPASLAALTSAVGLTFYVKYLTPSLTLLDLGIREGGAVLFFQMFGLGAAAGLNAAVLLFAINVILPAAAGVPFAVQLPIGDAEDPASSSAKFSSIPSRP